MALAVSLLGLDFLPSLFRPPFFLFWGELSALHLPHYGFGECVVSTSSGSELWRMKHNSSLTLPWFGWYLDKSRVCVCVKSAGIMRPPSHSQAVPLDTPCPCSPSRWVFRAVCQLAWPPHTHKHSMVFNPGNLTLICKLCHRPPVCRSHSLS